MRRPSRATGCRSATAGRRWRNSPGSSTSMQRSPGAGAGQAVATGAGGCQHRPLTARPPSPLRQAHLVGRPRQTHVRPPRLRAGRRVRLTAAFIGAGGVAGGPVECRRDSTQPAHRAGEHAHRRIPDGGRRRAGDVLCRHADVSGDDTGANRRGWNAVCPN